MEGEGHKDLYGRRWEELTADFLLVTLENSVFFHCADVEYANGLVSRSTGDHVSVR